MSRGWESKSVEGQQAEAEAGPPARGGRSEGAQGKPLNNIPSDAASRRRRQELELQRERILSERTSSPHRRTALETALGDIEEKLTELGWVLHL